MSHAVIVAHGQPSDPEPAEAALAEFASDISTLAKRVSVHSATLAAPDALEAALDSLPENSVIYPLFMAKGWFVTSALPKRVGNRIIRILDPLGIDPDLPDLVASSVRNAVSELGWQTESTDLVIAAHGSGRSRNPSAVAGEFVDQLTKRMPFQSMRLGFVEELPSIAEAAANTGDQALCLPFFACRGGHVLEDVPQELSKAGFRGQTLPVIGELPPIKQHIAGILDKAFAT
ncbi:CbiX/SirB N-terminal domain-containing protein [Roseibium sp. RKSG952]|uniref:CbiX/SirB N-terminal domain-containing protein n=1 Tax=Roseibium sp. RKSG952 TaxID=2529384 RepID=UPI0012BC1F3A|nr:CbiX/SirB N-terminal domain-containing protein [Roseibium sp. RKSG952]MTI01883.1 cobalamin biosynthesis protein CbiX [Roseibium sp. RKSG952]